MTTQPNNIREKARFNAVRDWKATGEGAEPVTLAEVKSFCKLNTGASEDTLLSIFITAARKQCEAYTNIGFVSKTITAVLNNSCGGIYFPYGPVTSITSVTPYQGTAYTVNQDYYTSGTEWTQLLTPKEDYLTVVYVAGYSSLPAELKLAVLQQVFYLYENRGDTSEVTRNGNPVESNLSPMAKTTLNRLKRVG